MFGTFDGTPRRGPLSNMYGFTNGVTIGQFTDIVIISMSYKRDAPPELPTKLQATKHDFCYLLREFKYGESTSTKFTLLHDFDAWHKNSQGVKTLLTRTDTRMTAIKKALKDALRNATRGRCALIYIGGHTIQTPKGRAIAVGDGQFILGDELRTWIVKYAKEPASVTIVLDACNTGCFLGRLFTYEESSGAVQVLDDLDVGRKPNYRFPIIEISAARSGQIAYAYSFRAPGDSEKPEYGGVLTWHFIRALRGSTEQSVDQLAKRLSTRCDTFEMQQFQVSTSYNF